MTPQSRLCAISVFILCSSVAKAQTAAVAFTDPLAFNNGQGYSLGYTFSTSTTFTITALGYYDAGTLTEQHEVGIFSSSGTLLTHADIVPTSQNSTLPVNDFEYTSAFTPVTLDPGTYEIMGTTGYVDPYAFSPATFSTAAGITFLADEFTYGSALARGTITDGELGYFGPNFLETAPSSSNSPIPEPIPAPTPEPNSLILLGSGVLGITTLLRRR